MKAFFKTVAVTAVAAVAATALMGVSAAQAAEVGALMYVGQPECDRALPPVSARRGTVSRAFCV